MRRYSDRGGNPVKRFRAALLLAAALCAVHTPVTAQPAPIAGQAAPAAERPAPPLAAPPPAAPQPAAPPPAATAAPAIYQLVPPDMLAVLLQRAGHRVQEAVPDPEAPRLVVSADGLLYGIDFYRCLPAPPGQRGPLCSSLRFGAAFDMPAGMTLAQANDWNRSRRFARVWLDADADPHLEMDASLAGGVTAGHVLDVLDWWLLVLGDFQQHLRSLAPPAAVPGRAQ